MDTQTTGPVTENKGDQNKLMSVLAYIGPLVIVSYLVAKGESSVKFHIKQGAVLFVLEIAVWVVGMMMPLLFPLLMLVNLATLVLAIVGILRVLKGEEKSLPVVGSFSKYFTF